MILGGSLRIAISALLVTSGLSWAALNVKLSDTTKALGIQGYGFLQAGQIVKGYGVNEALDHRWIESQVLGLGAIADLNRHTRVIVNGEGQIVFSSYVDQAYGNLGTNVTRLPQLSFAVTQAEGLFNFADATRNGLIGEIGYFPYKYNQQSQNLGEYLFRTRCYPAYIDNSFDYAYQRLLGLRLGGVIAGSFKQDVLLTSEVTRFPLQDWSLSYVAGYSRPNIADVGVGLNFDRIFSVDDRFTSPQKGINAILVADTLRDSTGIDTAIVYDTTGHYTFAGTKIDAHLTIDIKGILKLIGVPVWFFGKEDLKIYGEAILLGVKDYPDYRNLYGNWKLRIPRMFGINLPAFKILDVAALEFEYFDGRFPNSYEQIFRNGVPLPISDPYNRLYPHDKWRWSFYAKKQIAKSVTITAQFARDHMHPTNLELDKPETFDVLPAKKHWWWVVKVYCGF
jgi:hypothetical protein